MESKGKKRKNDDEEEIEVKESKKETIKKSKKKTQAKSKSKNKNKSKSKQKIKESKIKSNGKNKEDSSSKKNKNEESIKKQPEEKENKEKESENKKETKTSVKKVSPTKSPQKKKQSTLESFGIKSEKDIDQNLPPCPSTGTLKFIHWNINGIRPLLKTSELNTLIDSESPDFLCFNEIKIDPSLISSLKLSSLHSPLYKSFWHCPTEKKGYAGTAILTKFKPISIKYGIDDSNTDNEGRVITLEYEKFYLIACYTPNAGENLKRLDFRIDEWDKKFFEYINELKNKKDIILCGDLNVANNEIDIFEPKGHEKSPGFTIQERDSFKQFLNEGFVDTFREKYPNEQKFSFFSKRSKAKFDNKGWRLDYFVVNKNNKNFKIIESNMLEKNNYNSSDHIPIKLEIELI